jgi:hypothetical protein
LPTHKKALGRRSQSSKDAGREIVGEGTSATCEVTPTSGKELINLKLLRHPEQ